LLKKATNLVRHDLIKRGVSSKEIVSPKTLTHFHINAIDDQVMYKLYQTSLIDQTNKSKPMGLNKDNFRSEIGQRHMDKIVLGFGNDIIPEELFSNTDGDNGQGRNRFDSFAKYSENSLDGLYFASQPQPNAVEQNQATPAKPENDMKNFL